MIGRTKEKRREVKNNDDRSVPFLIQSKASTRKTKNVTTLQSLNFLDSITYSISRGTFSSNATLKSISLPNSVSCIGEGAFEYCTSLTSITIPESVTYIGESAFNGCRSLRTFVVPESVFAIRACAFENCTSLLSIIIPDSVTYIEDCALAYCPLLKCISLPSALMYFGRSVFVGCDALEKRYDNGINNHLSVEIWLRRRFENLPLHQACYFDAKNMTLDKFASLITENEDSLCIPDSMGMTPFHILSCNPTATPEMIKALKVCSRSSKDIYGISPLMNFLASRGIHCSNSNDTRYFDSIKDGPSLNTILALGLQCDDLEKLLAYDNEAAVMNEMETFNEKTGLNPMMTAASLPYCGLDLVYTLAMKYPDICVKYNR
jgi:hypothetical protein